MTDTMRDLSKEARKYEGLYPNTRGPKNKGPQKTQSTKFTCPKFSVWVSGNRKELFVSVANIDPEFNYSDEFINISPDNNTRIDEGKIYLGMQIKRAKANTKHINFSYFQLYDYFVQLTNEFKEKPKSYESLQRIKEKQNA